MNRPLRPGFSRSLFILSLLPAGLISLVAVAQPSLPVARVGPVSDTYFDTLVTDPYRWMESGGAELTQYMQSEDKATRLALAPYAKQQDAIFMELEHLASAVPIVRSARRVADQYLYLEVFPDRDDAVLMTRDIKGGTARILLDPRLFAHEGRHAAIDYFEPSNDGRLVAVGISLGGSEDSTLHVVDATTGTLLAESISRGQEAQPAWVDDGSGFYYTRLQELPDEAKVTEKYDNVTAFYHRLGDDPSDDQPVFGYSTTPELGLPKRGDVQILHAPGTTVSYGLQRAGVVETVSVWRLGAEGEPATEIMDHGDGAMHVALHGTRIFVLTKKDANNGRLVSFDGASETFAKAKTLLGDSDLILSAARGSTLVAAHDALYLLGLENGLSVLKRMDYEHPDQLETLTLPYAGSITDMTADPLRNGVVLTLTSWIAAPRVLAYTEKKGFVNTSLQPDHPADVSMLESKEVLVSSRGGVQVPLSIIARKDLRRDGTAPTLMIAYGAYGYSMLPSFSSRFLPWLNRGGVVAVAHVRGGGEKGEAWHLDGMKEKKQHTVDDFVACANYLIDQRYTAHAHLAIEGTSAGGIAVGGFLTQHPELISAVLYRVGITDLLRSEQRATGAANASEYGSVQIESEFRAMLAISPYEHVFDDVKYPAVLLETGANDPRVTSWMLTKMAAKLQAAEANQANHRPTLLRVDFDAGHGIGSDRRQALLQSADEFTFLGWQLGMNGFDAR